MPWALAKDESKQDRLSTVLYHLVAGICIGARDVYKRQSFQNFSFTGFIIFHKLINQDSISIARRACTKPHTAGGLSLSLIHI